MTGFFNKEPDHAPSCSRCTHQPAAPAADRRHEHAAFLTGDAAQLSPRHRTPGDIPRAFTRHGDRRRPAPVPDRAAGGRRSRADDEQHRVGAALLLHPDGRPSRSGAQARPAGAPAQAARGAQPRRGRPAAQRHHLPQAPGRAVGRLWRGPARRRGVDAEGRRRRQRAHAAARRARQGRAVPQCHAVGRTCSRCCASGGRSGASRA